MAILPPAITLGGFGVNGARGLVPVIGGLLLAANGAASAFLVNASTYVGLIRVLLFRKNAPHPINANTGRISSVIGAAFRFTCHSALIHAMLNRNGC